MLRFIGKVNPPPKFTPEQYREIEEARARNNYYRATIERYPYREPDAPETTPRIVEHIHRHSDMSKAEFDLLQQTALKVDHLEKQLTEREPPKAQGKKFEYKGIK